MIQLKLEFHTHNKFITEDYNSFILSFLKSAINDYSNELYNELYKPNTSIMKPYTFSFYLPGSTPTVNNKEKGFLLNNTNFSVYFSCSDMLLLIHFINALKLKINKEFPVKNNIITLKKIVNKTIHKITNNEIIIKTNSPILVRNNDKNNNTIEYLSYNDNRFNEALLCSIEFMLNKFNKNYCLNNFSIEPIIVKSFYAKTLKEFCLANIGYFRVKGDVELLNWLLVTGIGARRSEGFGKFEVII